MKLGPPSRFVLGVCVTIAAAAATGCGYRSALVASPASGGGLSVAAAPFATPHLAAVDEALGGARDELVRAGRLRSAPYPRLVIELVRVDELPAGMAALPGQGALGRGSNLGVVGRGWIEQREGAAPAEDTGDVRRVETVAQGRDAVPSAEAAAEAIRSAARAVGRAIARRALGLSEPAVEPM